jgi:hypothetical protein
LERVELGLRFDFAFAVAVENGLGAAEFTLELHRITRSIDELRQTSDFGLERSTAAGVVT